MPDAGSALRGRGDAPPDPWDPLVRLTHWVIAVAVILNQFMLKPGGTAHVTAGWVVMAALGLRLAWGVLGPVEARFSAFPPSPRRALAHLGGLLRGQARDHPSHNPAGGLMVYALWACLAVVVATGLVMTGGRTPMTVARERAAVAAGDWSVLVTPLPPIGEAGAETEDDDDATGTGHLAEDIHEAATSLLLVLAILHVAGVAVESRVLGRNLVRPMIRGPGKDA